MAIANSDGSIIITTKLDVTPVSKALNTLKSKFASLKEQRSAIQALTTAIKDQQFVIKQLEMEYAMLIARGQGNTAQAEALKTRLAALKLELTQLRGAASAMGVKTAAAFTKASAGLMKFGKRVAGIIKSALVFSVLYKAMQSIVKLFNKVLMSDEEFKQDWEELKAAFYAAAYPIVEVIVPAIKFIVRQTRDWAVSIGKVAAAIQDMSYSELVDQAQASKEAADNYADMEKSSKKTADNVKKQLASFDDIQILSSGNEEENQYTQFDALKQYDSSGAKNMLGDVMNAVGGALMALGVILLFHGQIAWGIGLIIAGAVGIAAATLTDSSVSQTVKDELSNVLLLVGVAAVIVGILLCMAQKWGLGIGLIALGVASIVAPIAFNWDGIKQQLQGDFGTWLAVGGIIAIVLGILLCFTSFLPLGIGLIALGAAAIVAPIVANWDAIKEAFTDEKTGGWIAVAGIVAIVLGILMCFAQFWAVGIGLIAVGATTVATSVVLNWDAIKQAFTDDKTAGWLAVGGIIAIILGILLCFAQMWALGIGLIALGAATVATVVTVNWDSIKAILTDEKFAGWIAVAGLVAVVLGILLCFVNLPLGIGLIALGATALVTVTALNWDAIVTNIKTFLFENSTLIALISGGLLILGIILCATGVGIPLGIALIAAGAAGLVTVTALNWGGIVDWIKNAWEAVKSFWNKYIAPVFTAKFWLDLAKKCGNGLISGFESAINGIISMFEGMINFIVSGLNKFIRGIDSVVSKVGEVFGKDWSVAQLKEVSLDRVSIPRLAQGAVIPPNREFLAVLGDQKQGTNIEAPLQTIVDAFNIALAQNGGGRVGNTEIVLEVNGREFGRAVVELGNQENRRIGTSLVMA